MNKYLIFLAIFCLIMVLSPLFASAAGLIPCGGSAPEIPCKPCHFFLLIKNVFNFIAFQLAPPVAVFLFLIAGFLLLISAGGQEKITQAKKLFINVVVGLVVVYVSWLLVGTLINVIGASGNIEGWNKESWNNFRCQ